MHLPPPHTGESLCDPVSFRQSVDTLKRQVHKHADQLYENKLEVVSAAVILRKKEVSRWEAYMLAQDKEQRYNRSPKTKARLISLRESVDGFTLLRSFPGLVSWGAFGLFEVVNRLADLTCIPP